MDFSFDEEQQSLGETVAQVLADYPQLVGPELSREQDPLVWNALAELGLFSLIVPEEHGGVGLALVDCAPAIEALGRGLAPPLVGSTLAAIEIIVRCGSAALKDAVLADLAAGSLKIAIAIDEAGQEDPLRPRCSVAEGKLSGVKISIPGAIDADAFLVVAQSDTGPVLGLVKRASPGVEVRLHDSIDPSAGLGSVRFEDAACDVESWISSPTSASRPEALLDVIAVVDAGIAIGIAGHMHDLAVEYAKTRSQFGQPIGAFQAIKHGCADMAVAIEAGRATAYYAFWACSSQSPEQSACASAAKAYCSEIARDACNESIQIHGGMGFTWELGIHRYLRRAKMIQNTLGGTSWHYARVLEKNLLGATDLARPHRDAA